MTELPDGWLHGRLSDFVQPRGEKAKPANHPDLPFIGMDHVEANTTKIIGSVPASDMKSSAAKFLAGDVLYGRLRPYLNKVAQPKFDGLASAEFIVFGDGNAFAPDFLRHRLNARDFVSFASHLNEGDRPRVNFDQIGDFQVLVPPINEQRRIVEKIETLFDEIDAGVESLSQARATLGLYRQSLLKSAFEGRLTADWRAQNADKLEGVEELLSRLEEQRQNRFQRVFDDWQDAVTDWYDNGKKGRKPPKPKKPDQVEILNQAGADRFEPLPKGWSWAPLSWLLTLDKKAMSTGPFGTMLKKQEHQDAGVPVLGIENIGQGRFIRGNKIFVTEDKAEELRAFEVDAADLIVSRSGTVGEICEVPSSLGRTLISTNLLRISLNQSVIRSPFFVFMFQAGGVVRSQVKELCKGSSRDFLNQSILKSIIFPICSPAEQTEIVHILDARLDAADRLEAEIDTAFTRAEALRQSILKKAFSGELVPQDPSDEPASVLLERIRAEKAARPKAPRKRKATA